MREIQPTPALSPATHVSCSLTFLKQGYLNLASSVKIPENIVIVLRVYKLLWSVIDMNFRGATVWICIRGQPVTVWMSCTTSLYSKRLTFFLCNTGLWGYKYPSNSIMAGTVWYTSSKLRLGSQVAWFKSHLCYLLTVRPGPSYLTFMWHGGPYFMGDNNSAHCTRF